MCRCGKAKTKRQTHADENMTCVQPRTRPRPTQNKRIPAPCDWSLRSCKQKPPWHMDSGSSLKISCPRTTSEAFSALHAVATLSGATIRNPPPRPAGTSGSKTPPHHCELNSDYTANCTTLELTSHHVGTTWPTKEYTHTCGLGQEPVRAQAPGRGSTLDNAARTCTPSVQHTVITPEKGATSTVHTDKHGDDSVNKFGAAPRWCENLLGASLQITRRTT